MDEIRIKAIKDYINGMKYQNISGQMKIKIKDSALNILNAKENKDGTATISNSNNVKHRAYQ